MEWATSSSSGGTESPIRPRPRMSIARPTMVCPRYCILFFLLKMKKRLMAAMAMGISGTLSAVSPPPNPKRVIIQAVTVVPMLAPITTAMAPPRVSRPAPAKPTVITVVAVELWIMAVTPVPARMPLRGLPVILVRMWRSFEPAYFCKPSLISFMAKRNTAKAPANFKQTRKISIIY